MGLLPPAASRERVGEKRLSPPLVPHGARGTKCRCEPPGRWQGTRWHRRCGIWPRIRVWGLKLVADYFLNDFTIQPRSINRRPVEDQARELAVTLWWAKFSRVDLPIRNNPGARKIQPAMCNVVSLTGDVDLIWIGIATAFGSLRHACVITGMSDCTVTRDRLRMGIARRTFDWPSGDCHQAPVIRAPAHSL